MHARFRSRARSAVAALALAGALATSAPDAPLAGSAPARAGAPTAAPAPFDEDAAPRGPSVAERLDEIRRRLAAAVAYPPIARRLELEGVAWLRFTVDRAGAAHDVELARSSGHEVLDRAALRAVARAGPLPWVYGTIEVPIRFALDEPPGGAW